MYNDEDYREDSVGGDEPYADNAEAPSEAEAPEEPVSAEEPSQTEAAAEPEYGQPKQETEAPKRTQHYEPWREPVYREAPAGEDAYSPGRYARGSCQQSPVPQSAVRRRERARAAKPKREGARLGAGRVIALIVVCAVIGCAAGGASAYFVSDYMAKNASRQVVIGSSTPAASDKESGASVVSDGREISGSDIYSVGCSQVVGVNTSVTTNIFGMTSTSAVSGSGFVISSDGYIITNYHVIEYAQVYGYPLTVLTYDGTSYSATIVGYEADNDIAVIKIDAQNLSAIAFGDSDSMTVGEKVFAIGNPLGELAYTMTTGYVSALDRIISTDEKTAINMFQFDAAVNSGNSGGPVYNAHGEVVGVVTAKYSDSGVEGLGFAIPINDAKSIATDIIENGYVTGKAQLGVQVQDVQSYVSQYYNIPEGAYVYSVNKGSCAEKAGLRQGDVITEIEDYDVKDTDSLKTALRKFKAGDTVKLEVYRSGEDIELTVVLDEAPVQTETDSAQQQQQQQQQQQYSGFGGFPYSFFGYNY